MNKKEEKKGWMKGRKEGRGKKGRDEEQARKKKVEMYTIKVQRYYPK